MASRAGGKLSSVSADAVFKGDVPCERVIVANAVDDVAAISRVPLIRKAIWFARVGK